LRARRIGSYEITAMIGEGGMGSVYRAARADQQYKKQVAIKVVKRGLDTPFALARFRSERQILANLEHPNIARLLDGGTTDAGLPYVVMELVDGMPIDEYCESHKLSIEERARDASIADRSLLSSGSGQRYLLGTAASVIRQG
jgi:serine/threonine protein kinase